MHQMTDLGDQAALDQAANAGTLVAVLRCDGARREVHPVRTDDHRLVRIAIDQRRQDHAMALGLGDDHLVPRCRQLECPGFTRAVQGDRRLEQAALSGFEHDLAAGFSDSERAAAREYGAGPRRHRR
jgi:hypothetical protein